VEELQVLPVLAVVAAAIVVDRRLLVVSKQVAPDVFYLPGGKPEPGESDDACLAREIAEELDATLETRRSYAVVSGVAALEGTPLRMTVHLATLDREPRAANEIAALDWFSPHHSFAGVLAPAVADSVVPRLVADGLL
jgi:8-oxo-dGTP pyrophosphatase MutT (NUDIX family)